MNYLFDLDDTFDGRYSLHEDAKYIFVSVIGTFPKNP